MIFSQVVLELLSVVCMVNRFQAAPNIEVQAFPKPIEHVGQLKTALIEAGKNVVSCFCKLITQVLCFKDS